MAAHLSEKFSSSSSSLVSCSRAAAICLRATATLAYSRVAGGSNFRSLRAWAASPLAPRGEISAVDDVDIVFPVIFEVIIVVRSVCSVESDGSFVGSSVPPPPSGTHAVADEARSELVVVVVILLSPDGSETSLVLVAGSAGRETSMARSRGVVV